jgi:hypothetical protein
MASLSSRKIALLSSRPSAIAKPKGKQPQNNKFPFLPLSLSLWLSVLSSDSSEPSRLLTPTTAPVTLSVLFFFDFPLSQKKKSALISHSLANQFTYFPAKTKRNLFQAPFNPKKKKKKKKKKAEEEKESWM